jgi:hypothetical protein
VPSSPADVHAARHRTGSLNGDLSLTAGGGSGNSSGSAAGAAVAAAAAAGAGFSGFSVVSAAAAVVTGLQEATAVSSRGAHSNSSRASANDTMHLEWLQVTRTLADNGPTQREVSTAHLLHIFTTVSAHMHAQLLQSTAASSDAKHTVQPVLCWPLRWRVSVRALPTGCSKQALLLECCSNSLQS